VLEAARASYLSIPAEARCQGPHRRPPGYPAAVREVETLDAAELAVYRDACERTGLTDSCFYMAGAGRSFGFQAYRRLYLNDCELRAASLHGHTPLRSALEILSADRPVSELGDHEMTCVATMMRTGRGNFCGRYPECCPTEQPAE
jgi:hypothetical protein